MVSAGVADPPKATTDESHPTYYLIQNWKTKEFYLDDGTSNALWSVDGVTNVGSGTNKHDVDDYLFYFITHDDGYWIGSKTAGAGKYLNDTDKYYSTLRGSYSTGGLSPETGFKSTGTTWYIAKCQYNNIGVEIRNSNKYWQRAHAGGHTSWWAIGLEDSDDVDEQVWILWSFDDLLDEAERHGLSRSTYESLDASQGSSFKTLVDAINAKKTAAYVDTYKSNFKSGKYLIRSRQYGTYLNTNGTSMSGTYMPTQYAVWDISKTGDQLTITGQGNKTIYIKNKGETSVTWNIGTDGEVWHPTFSASHDNNNGYISFSSDGTSKNARYFGMGKTSTETKSDFKPSCDWELIPVADDMTYQSEGATYTIDTAINSEDDLVPAEEDPKNGQFFRIKNVTRDVSAYQTDQFNGGGWLEDVDHTHFTYRKSETSASANRFDQEEADRMYKARTVEFYTALPNMGHASALWEFILVGHGKGSGENATGVISPEHNIYKIRNANTGKYIGKKKDTPLIDGVYYPEATDNANEAALFYIVKLMDGQYALHGYGSTNGSGVDQSKGVISTCGSNDGYQGGLGWVSTATMNTNAAWIICPAPTLQLPLLVCDVQYEEGKESDQYDWTTFYFPFDVTLGTQQSGQQVTFYEGGWKGTYTYGNAGGQIGGSIQMIPVTDVPAHHPVFVSSTKDGNESYEYITLNVYPAGSGRTTTQEETFSSNIWRGIIESSDDFYWGSGSGWRDYWVLSKNSKGYLRLLHPAGNYLLPNRAYIDTETTEAISAAKVSAFDMVFDTETIPTSIQEPAYKAEESTTIYTITGQRIDSSISIRNLPKGIYVVNGKKIFIH